MHGPSSHLWIHSAVRITFTIPASESPVSTRKLGHRRSDRRPQSANQTIHYKVQSLKKQVTKARSLGLYPAIRLVGTGTTNPTKGETASLYPSPPGGNRASFFRYFGITLPELYVSMCSNR
jgi:hypothetical protein